MSVSSSLPPKLTENLHEETFSTGSNSSFADDLSNKLLGSTIIADVLVVAGGRSGVGDQPRCPSGHGLSFRLADLDARAAPRPRAPSDNACQERLLEEAAKLRSGLRQIAANQHSELDRRQFREPELDTDLAYATGNAVWGSN